MEEIKKPLIVQWGKNEKWLNAQQEHFCQCYISNDKELFGNWVQSYIEAYDPDTTKKNRYKSACVSASQLLSNIKVITRINELLEEWGLNDEFVDKQLLFLVQQHSDFGSKMRAIWEYNRLKQRITQKIESKEETINYNIDVTNLTPEQIEEQRKKFLS